MLGTRWILRGVYGMGLGACSSTGGGQAETGTGAPTTTGTSTQGDCTTNPAVTVFVETEMGHPTAPSRVEYRVDGGPYLEASCASALSCEIRDGYGESIVVRVTEGVNDCEYELSTVGAMETCGGMASELRFTVYPNCTGAGTSGEFTTYDPVDPDSSSSSSSSSSSGSGDTGTGTGTETGTETNDSTATTSA
ncbi:MAG: hypothetical protein JNK45_11135 [Myxococcales bacterium]|nr:hypothetical protein [Myxococcales bacterium]